jgi:RNA polymerase sigma factor (sigma-70 family)
MQRFDDSTSDAQLIEQCLSGRPAAWQQLVQRHAPLVHSVPVRYGLMPVEVDDIGQEVFLALAQRLHQIEDPARLPAWLITTSRRFTWRALQKRRLEQPAPEEDLASGEALPRANNLVQPLPSMSELLASWQRQEALQQGLQRLGKRCRTLLELIFLDPSEPSYEEISDQLRIPKGSIGPTRNRCLQQLRSILEGLGFDSLE